MKIKKYLPTKKHLRIMFSVFMLTIITSVVITVGLYFINSKQKSNTELSNLLKNTQEELEKLKNEDQVKINSELKEKVNNIENTYKNAVTVYEDLLKLKENIETEEELDNLYAKALVALADQNFEEAQRIIDELNKKIEDEEEKLTAIAVPVPQAEASNTPPGAGYKRQTVSTDVGSFTVSLIAGDLGNTKVIVDTASDSSCANDCPVLSLGDYISRNGAYAGVNGSYFCPASYPSCAGKTNSFDTLLMNKNKTYFNSDNNVYSNVPAVIFGGSYVRFVGRSLDWGRDTGIDSMIANQPLLVSGGNIVFGGDGDPKKGSRAGRSFVASRGNTVFIGVVHGATVAESAHALKALGMENALNLDSGGSTALWSGGYKAGPGRNIPNAILFINK